MAEFDDGFLRAQGERGSCRVVCFSPRHDLTLGRMDPADVRRVIDVWAEQTSELGADYRWVQVFENRGEAMGASNPHPHGQVWAGTALPGEAAREDAAQRRYLGESGRRLLLDYIDHEFGQRAGRGGERGLARGRPVLGDLAVRDACHPEAARGPPRRARRVARQGLVRALQALIGRYDGLFNRPFPYSMGWHGAPFGGDATDAWQVHAHFYPPLLRATVRKFMVGYELLAETQRDLTAEDAAGRLRDVIPADVPDPAGPGRRGHDGSFDRARTGSIRTAFATGSGRSILPRSAGRPTVRCGSFALPVEST